MNTLPPHANPGKTTFIYALVDPQTELVRYIGKSDNPQKRLKEHIWSKDKERTYKSNWLNSLAAKGLAPLLLIIEEVPYGQWMERERYWIAYYRQTGYSLTNNTDGGDGTPGIQRSPETCALISRIHTGMRKTPEQRAAQSALYKRLGHRPPLEVVEQNRQRLKGKPVLPETLAKKRATIQAKKDAGIHRKKRGSPPPELLDKQREAMLDYWQHEREQGNRAMLTNEQAAIIKFNAYGLKLQSEYAEMFGVSSSTTSAIVCGDQYKHITREHLPFHLRDKEIPLLPYPPKITDEEVAIIKFNVYGLKQKEYAQLFGVSQPTISAIVNNHTYQYVTRDHLPPASVERKEVPDA